MEQHSFLEIKVCISITVCCSSKERETKRAKEKPQLQIDCIANRATAPSLAEGTFGLQCCLLCSDVEEHRHMEICKNKLSCPEDVAFISSQSSVD